MMVALEFQRVKSGPWRTSQWSDSVLAIDSSYRKPISRTAGPEAKYGDTIPIHPSSPVERSSLGEVRCNRYDVTGLNPWSFGNANPTVGEPVKTVPMTIHRERTWRALMPAVCSGSGRTGCVDHRSL